jgi:hypothetical protein
MPMLYHSEPNRAEPARWIWFSVETASTFTEYKRRPPRRSGAGTIGAITANWKRSRSDTASPSTDRPIWRPRRRAESSPS